MNLMALEIENVNVVISVHKHKSFESHSFSSQVAFFLQQKVMPRVTKADLTVSLEESQSLVKFLEYDNKAWKGEVARLKEENARLKEENAGLKEENVGLKAERGQRARSRAPRRDAMRAAAAQRALKLVQHVERDAVIDEQRGTIARQQQEIASLRRAMGPLARSCCTTGGRVLWRRQSMW